MTDKMKKDILAVDIVGLRTALHQRGFALQEGLNSQVDFETFLECAAPHVLMGQRGFLEVDLSKWQLLPYFDIEQKLADSSDSAFYAYVRGAAGGESRLHGLHSCGFGGHIDDDDVVREPPAASQLNPRGPIKLRETLTTGALRELLEELVVTGCSITDLKPKFNGLIIDHSNIKNDAIPVGAVHLGLSFSLQVPIGASVRSGEEMEIQLLDEPVTANNLLSRQIEGWTRIRLESLASCAS